jgi:hypothetical protein
MDSTATGIGRLRNLGPLGLLFDQCTMHIKAEGRNIQYFIISGLDSVPSPLTRHIETWETSIDIFCTTQELRRCMATAAMSLELGSPRGFCHRPGIARLRVGANGSEEQTDLDFGLERCGEIWSLKHLVCVIGHLVHRVVPVEWRHSNVGRVCRGKANHNSKEFLNQCSIIALAS